MLFIHDLISKPIEHDSPGFTEELWSSLNHTITLKDCTLLLLRLQFFYFLFAPTVRPPSLNTCNTRHSRTSPPLSLSLYNINLQQHHAQASCTATSRISTPTPSPAARFGPSTTSSTTRPSRESSTSPLWRRPAHASWRVEAWHPPVLCRTRHTLGGHSTTARLRALTPTPRRRRASPRPCRSAAAHSTALSQQARLRLQALMTIWSIAIGRVRERKWIWGHTAARTRGRCGRRTRSGYAPTPRKQRRANTSSYYSRVHTHT